jgi:hypothetical protein
MSSQGRLPQEQSQYLEGLTHIVGEDRQLVDVYKREGLLVILDAA